MRFLPADRWMSFTWYDLPVGDYDYYEPCSGKRGPNHIAHNHEFEHHRKRRHFKTLEQKENAGKYVPHPPPYRRLPHKIHSTLGHLIEILEQLSSKEELSSVLHSIVAESDDTSPANSCGSSRVDLDPSTIIKVAQILCKLNPNCTTMATTEHEGTKMDVSSAILDDVSKETPGKGHRPSGGEWAQRTIDCKNLSLSKQDSLYLVKKIRDFEQKCKPLQEKNKRFLERNMELTTLNRNLKEQIKSITEENKKLKDSVEQNKKKCNTLSQQLSKEKMENETMSAQVKQLDELKGQIIEQCKVIGQLKQASQENLNNTSIDLFMPAVIEEKLKEKDRRMEVLQQRKKRRLRMSAEHLARLSSPCSGIDDDRSIDSDLSMSSMSGGTLSDDDLLEELPHDEVEKTEKKFKMLMKEHLALQKSMAKLQGLIGKTDPERFIKMRTTFETDMYIAQCKIDSLEESLEKYKESDLSWVMEKDQLSEEINSVYSQNKSLTDKLKEMTESLREITQAYEESQEQKEDLEFLILETQAATSKSEKPNTSDVSTETDNTVYSENPNNRDPTKTEHTDVFHINELERQLEMAEEQRRQYQATIKTLEEKLTQLLQGQGVEVNIVMEQLKQAEMHVEEVESTMQELQNKVICLQEEKSVLINKLERCKEKLDAQEQSLSLTRDEREELLQVKPKSSGIQLNSRLRLAEVGHDTIRERSLERERPLDRIRCSSPLPSPRITRTLSETSIDSLSTIANDRPGEDETVLTVSNFDTVKQPGFDKDLNATGADKDLNESVIFDDLTPRRPRINSVPVLSSTMAVHHEVTHEVDQLQKQIAELREENDVLRYQISQKCQGDGYGSGSDSEDPRSVELRETCDKLRERAQTAEALERQYKDRLKLAEKHIGELEVSESVLRDRVEEGNADCDKLRKQIIRLQRKIRELKDVNVEKDNNELTLSDKVKYLAETEKVLSQKITELEGDNHILRQRLDLKDELLGDADFGDNLRDKVKVLEAENASLNAKLIEIEEDNEILRENWRKVADEEANRRDCLEDKIRVLENSNKELKAKLKEQETDLDLSGCQSLASEINEDIIESLNAKIAELEEQLQNVAEEKNKKIEALQETLDKVKESEVRLRETVVEMEHTEKQLKTHIAILEKSEHSSQTMSTVVGYEKKINELKSSQENLLEALDSMENHEDNLKQRLLDMENSYEKKIDMLEKEIAEYQQQEEDLCTRVEELVEKENNLLEKIDKFKESEMNFRNKIEELENRETSLTVSFSQRMEELEKSETDKSEKFLKQLSELEKREVELNAQIDRLTSDNESMALKLSSLEKHDNERSEKTDSQYHEQMNSELLIANTNNSSSSIELQTKVESITRLEKEACANLLLKDQIENKKEVDKDRQSAGLDNQNYKSDQMLQNQSLLQELSKLTDQIKELEKDKKSLLDQMKRQEKKRKKSQRNDNVEDYDTLAREVVTYKLEVEQLRSENNDLHERIMELDDSEKNLLEQNENLKSALETSNNTNTASEKEGDLERKVHELEAIEAGLKKELVELRESKRDALEVIRQPSSDSAYESGRETMIKETVDKQIGTEDFMEGVMGTHEQGKPVSSMFQRIQALEADNLELEQKLSVLTATDAQVRLLSDKVKALEENEDSLMERVMELEDEEDRLNLELKKLRKQASLIPELQDQINQLEDKEQELNDTKGKLEQELDTLKNSIKSSDVATGDIAIRLASVQKMYEDEKKKVEALLKGEEKLMKSVASEKKSVKALEAELTSTQEKLEELQTEYESKLSEKDESVKLLKDEVNKLVREREVLKKKLQEFEISNNELEDEVAACKISESRMFHRHQQLITQNEELENKLAKLAELVPDTSKETKATVDRPHELLRRDNSMMAENPDLVSENPLTASIFTDQELDVLRSKTPDTELLGSMPLDMLRKIQDFDERETNYQAKIKELENRNIKTLRKVKVLQSREKDLKHEIKELQLEILKHRDSTSSLHASVSSFDQDRSGSDDGLDIDSGDDFDNEIFKPESHSQYEDMTQEQLLLSVKLLEEKVKQENRRLENIEQTVDTVKQLLKSFADCISSESLQTYIQNVDNFNQHLQALDLTDDIWIQLFSAMLASVTGVKQHLETLKKTEENLRVSLAEKEETNVRLRDQSSEQIEELELQIKTLTSLQDKYPAGKENEEILVSQSLQFLEKQISQSDSCIEAETQTDFSRQNSPFRDNLHLDTSKIITIDVPPTLKRDNITHLGQSETIKVNVPPTNLTDDIDYDSEASSSYYNSTGMMDKAEDVLRQRIRELEKLDKHLKQQVHDLEVDREELHEIARKDKNIIHEQNVQLRELQLSQKNLQEQIQNFEESENSLYARLDELENELENKDDRIRHLEILEQRLKDLVKQYKLDEKILVTKSETLETSMKEMSAKEETLKEKVQNLESEKNAFCERSEYLQTRLKELENAELDLAQRAKNQENIVQSLQNTVIELETFGANAQARVVELEQANFELQQRLHHAMAENSPVTKHASSLKHQCDKLEEELSALRDSEIRLRQDNDSLEKNERTLQEKVKTLQLKEVELETKVRNYSENESHLKDKIAKLQRSENTLKYRVQELENSGIQAPSDLESSLRENNKLPRTLEDCQRRIIMLQANNAELQGRLLQYQNGSVELVQGTKVARPQSDVTVAGSRLSPRIDTTTVDPALEPVEEMTKKTTTGDVQIKPPGQMMSRDHIMDDLLRGLKAPNILTEDAQWREIETRMEAQSRGNEQWINIGKATSMYATNNSKGRSPNKDEVLELHVALQSETESHLNSQNDTDSGRFADKAQSSHLHQHRQSQLYNEVPPPPPQFGPPTVGHGMDHSFVESLNTNTMIKSLDGTSRELRQGHMTHQHQRTPSVTDSLADSGRGTASVSLANFGMTLKERIANIERQLSTRESDSAREITNETDLTSWKARVMESNRKLEIAEKDNKYYKDEINKLEKELEEKSRQYIVLEAFLNAVELVLTQQNLDDEGMIEKIEKEVENVRHSLADAAIRPSSITNDPAALNTELSKKERELAAKRNEVDRLMCELRQWQQECRTIEDMRSNALDSLRGLEMEITELQEADKQFKQLKDDYNTLKGQLEEEKRKKSPQNTATLRAKILQLTNLCNEKDILIKKLVQELKSIQSGGEPSQLLDELLRLDPSSDGVYRQLGRSSSQSSIESGENPVHLSDTELLRDSSPRNPPRPRSADVYHHKNMNFRQPRIYANRSGTDHYNGAILNNDGNNRRHAGQSLNRSRDHVLPSPRILEGTPFIAIADYDPSVFSQSGHQRLELFLKEGDFVTVMGPADKNGYFEGEVNGIVGLVPAGYLQPIPPLRRVGSAHVPGHLNASPERIAQMYSALHGAHQRNIHGINHPLPINGYTNGDLDHSKNSNYISHVQVSGPPQVPENFHVEKIVGNSSLMLAWQQLPLDNSGCNTGVKVTGYRIYKNNKVLMHPHGPRATKAVIENIDIHAHHRFGIQTISADGQVSELSEIMYEGVEEVSDENSDTESEMDMSTVLDQEDFKHGPKRTFMAVYDYDPTKNSPQDHPTSELAFSAGDVITVFGRQRADGFYHGQINGTQGLVPAFFIEEVPQPPPRTKKLAAKNKQAVKEQKTEGNGQEM